MLSNQDGTCKIKEGLTDADEKKIIEEIRAMFGSFSKFMKDVFLITFEYGRSATWSAS